MTVADATVRLRTLVSALGRCAEAETTPAHVVRDLAALEVDVRLLTDHLNRRRMKAAAARTKD